MSTPREEGEGCPLDGEKITLDKCQNAEGTCRYFRGASNPPGRTGWRITCNWPRSGAYIDPNPDRSLPAFDPDFWNSALE